jgi:hypothetical protein
MRTLEGSLEERFCCDLEQLRQEGLPRDVELAAHERLNVGFSPPRQLLRAAVHVLIAFFIRFFFLIIVLTLLILLLVIVRRRKKNTILNFAHPSVYV